MCIIDFHAQFPYRFENHTERGKKYTTKKLKDDQVDSLPTYVMEYLRIFLCYFYVAMLRFLQM